MWFPYSLPTHWKRECDRERSNDSFGDQEPREFLIGFQLRNPVIREWSVELQLKEPFSTVQRDLGGQAVSIACYPDEHERLAEITCKLEDTEVQRAVQRAYLLVSRMLSFWAADYGRGFAIGGLRIADLKHSARWRIVPHWPSAQSFQMPLLEGLPEGLWQVAELYREARTSSSDRHRFLCCDTILRIWSSGKAPFNGSGEVDGGAAQRVTQDLMVLSGMINFHPEFEGTAFAELPERLKDWRRQALDHLLEGPSEGVDDLDRAMERTAVANLVDLVAHQILSALVQEQRGTEASEAGAPAQSAALGSPTDISNTTTARNT